MIQQQLITLILPCRNEEKALPVLASLLPKGIDEVIVVDNGSKDNTVSVAKRLGFRVFAEDRHVKGIGYGYALQKGILNARGDIIICMDGDGSYPVNDTPRLISHLLSEKLDFISCNRLPFTNPKDMSFIRKTGVIILNTTILALYGKIVHDSLTGMWVFKKEKINQLRFMEGGWDFSLEIKLRALTSPDIAYEEVHIPYKDRVLGNSKQKIFQTGFNHFKYLWKFKAEQLYSVARTSRPSYS
jgi:glycosyltransferase involved in cell wall biosynthesis